MSPAGAEHVPALREGVRLEVLADGNGTLSDALMGRRIKLDARAVGICAHMARGATTVSAIAEDVGAPAESVQSFVAKLVSLDLCATERAAARAGDREALAAVKDKPALHLRMLEGARFACTMCGSCCGGHNVGPVSEAVLDGLEPELDALAEVVRGARRVDKDLFLALPSGASGGKGDLVCSASHGSCVFLDDGGLCRIHARLGGAAKPLPCRIFPYELVATPTGVRVTVQRECRDFLRATGPDMPTLEAAGDEVAALVEALETLPAPTLVPKLRGVELRSWAAWEALEGELAAAIGDDPRTTFAALAALAGPARDAAQRPTFAAWRAALIGALRQIQAQAPAPNERVRIRVDALALSIDALADGRGWALARALAPLTDDDARRLFREHLRHALWSTAPLRATSVEAGLGRLAAEWVLARLVALARARTVKRFHVTAQDLQDGLVTASFLFRHDDLRALLAELDPLTTAVFVDGIDALFSRAPDDDEPDRRVELVKF